MPDITKFYKFAGFSSPNTTPVPDVLFDELLQQLDNAELRVLLYIIRRTYGFKKSLDDISIGQMVDGITRKDGTVLDSGTGLARTSVKRAIRGLLEKNIIIRKHNEAADGGNEPNTYGLYYETPKQEETPRNEPETPRSAGGPTPLVSPTDPPLGPSADPTRNSRTRNRFFEYSKGCAKRIDGRSCCFQEAGGTSCSSSARDAVRDNDQAGRSTQASRRASRPLSPTTASTGRGRRASGDHRHDPRTCP
jgi:hypothetical protein